MHNKLLCRFLSNSKAFLSGTRTNYVVKKDGPWNVSERSNFLLLLVYGYIGNNLARIGGYPTHRYVADMSNLFYFHFVFI